MSEGTIIVAGDHDEAERLALRGCEAIDGSRLERAYCAPHRGRRVIATPRGSHTAGPGILHSHSCEVVELPANVDLDNDDILQVKCRPMFSRVVDNSSASDLPQIETALSLMERDMPQISYLCDPWIPEGLNILAGRPKLGKTTLLRQKLAAVAGGDAIMGQDCVQATCLFISIEEGDRLTNKKFQMAGFDDAALASILIAYKWSRGKDGVLDLMRVLDDNESIRYIGIDSLTRFRDLPDSKTPAFVCDYEAVSELHSVAKSRPGICIDVVHHTRKAKSDDPIEDISGTFGVSAACDSYWVMRHHEDGAVLHVGGRLWESDTCQFQLRRADQRWELVGEFIGINSMQAQTLDAIRGAKGMTPTQLASTFGIRPSSAHARLDRLVREGLVKNEHGCYFAR